MASLMRQGDRFYCQFLHHGKRHCFSLGRVDSREAQAKASQVDYLLMRLKQGLVQLPPGMDIVSFLQFDGKPPEQTPSSRGEFTLKQLKEQYMNVHEGTLEQTSTDGMQLHFKHLATTLGDGFPLRDLSLAELQSHADRRKKMKGIGGKLSPATVRKELITLRTVWNWGVHMGLVEGRFPALKRVKMAKPDEKPHFQTRAEIERKTRGLDPKRIDEYWDAALSTCETRYSFGNTGVFW